MHDPQAPVLTGGLNTLGHVSWKEHVEKAFTPASQVVPASYVDWTHGPSFLEFPENPAQRAGPGLWSASAT